jgi:hypothetical protein
MKLFAKFLRALGIGAMFYPIGVIVSYFEVGGNVCDLFWLEILILDIIGCILLFLFIDVELVKRIRNKKQKKNRNK